MDGVTLPLLSITLFTQLLFSPAVYLSMKRSKLFGDLLAIVASFIPFSITIYLFNTIYNGLSIYEEYWWIPAFKLKLGLLLDSTSYPFSLLISLMGFLATIYSTKYMEHEHGYPTYMALLLMFNAGMIGVVLATNLFLLYIFWELMLIPSYFLIAYWGTGKPRIIGFKYFIFTHAGALAMLFGIIWIYVLYGTLEIPQLSILITSSPENFYIFILIFIGAAVKMAIFPFHTWLPDAHAEAPTPISVLLSGVMIKTGAYVVVRILIGLYSSIMPSLTSLLIILSLISMIWGGLMAMVQIDVKRLLAYSSISQMGYILFGLTTMDSIGIAGGIFHILNHGFAKGLLFMCSGVLIHILNERDINKLGGLASRMPLTAIAMLLGGLSIAGTPPLGGFASEWMIFGGGFNSGLTIYTAIAIANTAITAGYYLRMIRAVFFLQPKHDLSKVHDAPISMAMPMSILILLVVILGFLNYPIITIISRTASQLAVI
ncbi:MAG: NADH-quinone oxidoreductase subunit M [Aigarchaeota archaeon]|nr:NADH-quinone oxidoreductase subunit M [Aigarchaeota archaeon]MCX8192323.1 NADH-quinone oxidoreductase subunit M [Nitrososphaeria archaeon]MDW7986847.1 NADH-quinone oxidoreductase subunit M [Nitrososphaerota archaeon]